ncbi:MAG: OsmC family protein [Cyclobacteriaceae bacterium]|nr:OsmC family protein [Cyclobacteriaceae bacterium]
MKNLVKTNKAKRVLFALFAVAIALPGLTAYTLHESAERIAKQEENKRKKTETAAQSINGFQISDIVGTVQAIQANPEIAKFEFRVKNKWIKGGHNRSWIKDFYGGGQEDSSRKKPFVHDNSEPPILLGNNEGANPVEYILHGLAGCMTTTMVLHAAANGIPIESVESRLEGDLDARGFLGLDENTRNGYQQIRVSFDIQGNLSADQKKKLESFVMKSPVFDIVSNKVPVSYTLNY